MKVNFLADAAKETFFYLLYLFKNKISTLTVFFFSILFFFSVYLGIHKLKIYNDSILPKNVEINITNRVVSNKVSAGLNDLITVANQKKQTRSEFLKNVGNLLNSIEFINQYWIRLGLDRNLQIDAIMQIPVMILESKYGEKYLVSSTMNIIAKNPDQESFPGLFTLSVPQVKIEWKPKDLLFKNKNNFSYNIGNRSVNFSWLTKQADIIHGQVQGLGPEYFFNKILWTSDGGFSLTILRKMVQKSVAGTESGSDKNFVVFIGNNDVVNKMQKLKVLLENLNNKNIYPSEIDLNYIDRASFKTL